MTTLAEVFLSTTAGRADKLKDWLTEQAAALTQAIADVATNVAAIAANTAGIASNSTQIGTLDGRVTALEAVSDWGGAVADDAALTAIAPADRVDKQVRLVEASATASGAAQFYRFDAEAVAGDLAPDAGTGYWLKVASTAVGSGLLVWSGAVDPTTAELTVDGTFGINTASAELFQRVGGAIESRGKLVVDGNPRQGIEDLYQTAACAIAAGVLAFDIQDGAPAAGKIAFEGDLDANIADVTIAAPSAATAEQVVRASLTTQAPGGYTIAKPTGMQTDGSEVGFAATTGSTVELSFLRTNDGPWRMSIVEYI